MNYMFDYQCFLDELRENPTKKDIVLRRDLWSQAKTIEEEPFYRDYLKHFSPIEFHTPEELNDDFNWKLLLCLVAGSFSSEYCFQYTDDSELPELIITVKSNNKEVTKTVSELWSHQILRLHEIYLEEVINIESLRLEDEFEAKGIENERIEKIKHFKLQMHQFNLEYIKRERAKILQ